MYESWRCLFQAFTLKKGNCFCVDLHWVHKVKTGQRHTEKRLKNLFHPQIKFYNVFQKTRVWVLTEFVAGFHIEKRKYFCLDLHYVHKVKTGQRHTQKRSKICFTRKWKFYNDFQKTSVWVMAVFVSDFIIEKRLPPLLRSTLCP